MQQAYFRSDGCSQTRAVREATLAAHYVLRHHNRDVLPLEQVNAATAVAALRGDTAFVALAGDAAAFAWRDGSLTGQRGVAATGRARWASSRTRVSPCGARRWAPRDRLVLVCGAHWRPDSPLLMQELLREHALAPAEALEERLAELLGGRRPAGVLVVEPGSHSSRPALRLVPAADSRAAPRSFAAGRAPAGDARRGRSVGRRVAVVADRP